MVQNAFKALEFADMAVESIWKLIGVILHLGNIDFDSKEDNGESIATISRMTEVNTIANLLHVSPEDLKQALLTRVIAAGGQVRIFRRRNHFYFLVLLLLLYCSHFNFYCRIKLVQIG